MDRLKEEIDRDDPIKAQNFLKPPINTTISNSWKPSLQQSYSKLDDDRALFSQEWKTETTTYDRSGRPVFFWGRGRGVKENSAIVNTRVQCTTLQPSDHLRLTPHRGDPPNRASCHPRRPMRGGSRNSHERIRERSGARDRDHAGPPLPPSQECRYSEQRWRVSGSGRRQIVDKLHGFLTPSSASVQCNHDQSASVPGQQLKILPFLVLAGPPAVAPSSTAALGRAVPLAVKTLRNVMSTANCAPWWSGSPAANTSTLSSLAGTAMSMSRNLQLQRTVAPASRHTWLGPRPA